MLHAWDELTVVIFSLTIHIQLVGAAFGAAGQRCMALTTAVLVGEANEWIEQVKEKALNLKVFNKTIMGSKQIVFTVFEIHI